jgi:hypothetical protein
MTPAKSPQVQGLPTGSGATKQMPADVEHFELACATFVNGAGVERATGSGTVPPLSSTDARPRPASARSEANAIRMNRISILAPSLKGPLEIIRITP